jgi:hypothetical protein
MIGIIRWVHYAFQEMARARKYLSCISIYWETNGKILEETGDYGDW